MTPTIVLHTNGLNAPTRAQAESECVKDKAELPRLVTGVTPRRPQDSYFPLLPFGFLLLEMSWLPSLLTGPLQVV